MKLGYKFLAALMLVAAGCGSKTEGTDIINDPIGAGDAGGASGGSNGMGGPGGTGANGDTNTGGTGLGNTDGTKCGGGVVRAMPTIPDMLIVLDKSGSMKSSGVNRWDPSVAGLKAITKATEKTVQFGLMSFPAASDQCAAGTLDEPIALNNADKIAAKLDGMMPDGGTPTASTLRAAHTQLMQTVAGPDATVHPQYVLLVTDGSPNCGVNPNPPPTCNQLAALFSGDQMCLNEWTAYRTASLNIDNVADTVAAIKAMADDGIKTYVIGYDTQSDASLAGAMDMMAVAGNTGDPTHRAVGDQDGLVKEFQEIAGSAISCDYTLEKEPPDPTYVLVEVDGKQLNLDEADGWSITGKIVTVKGKACASLQDGQDHTLNVEVKCEVVPII